MYPIVPVLLRHGSNDISVGSCYFLQYLPSQSLNLAVSLQDPRAQTADVQASYAIVNIPPSFSRWYEVPAAAQDGDSTYKQVARCANWPNLHTASGWVPSKPVCPQANTLEKLKPMNCCDPTIWHVLQAYLPVEQIIEHNLSQLFGGAIIHGVYLFRFVFLPACMFTPMSVAPAGCLRDPGTFLFRHAYGWLPSFHLRVTRNADLEVHEDEAEDLLVMVSDELRERRFVI